MKKIYNLKALSQILEGIFLLTRPNANLMLTILATCTYTLFRLHRDTGCF